ncbi:MAG: hypothetical protein KDK91_07630 [Gammaproteobacteria bacterium]|nr:hypothetical protein [Gammaproteobacteria bacterium]
MQATSSLSSELALSVTAAHWLALIMPILLLGIGLVCVGMALLDWRRGARTGHGRSALLMVGAGLLLGAGWLVDGQRMRGVATQQPASAQELVALREQGEQMAERLRARLASLEMAVREASERQTRLAAGEDALRERLEVVESARTRQQSIQEGLQSLGATVQQQMELQQDALRQLDQIRQARSEQEARLNQRAQVADTSLATLAEVQGAILRWGVSVSREMRERVGPVATLQMAELDRLRSRSETVQARHQQDAEATR